MFFFLKCVLCWVLLLLLPSLLSMLLLQLDFSSSSWRGKGTIFFWHNVLIYVKMPRHWFEQLRTSHQVLEGLVKWLLKKVFVLVYANEWDKTFFKPISKIFRCVIIWFFHRILHDLSLFFVRLWWIRNSCVDFLW